MNTVICGIGALQLLLLLLLTIGGFEKKYNLTGPIGQRVQSSIGIDCYDDPKRTKLNGRQHF